MNKNILIINLIIKTLVELILGFILFLTIGIIVFVFTYTYHSIKNAVTDYDNHINNS